VPWGLNRSAARTVVVTLFADACAGQQVPTIRVPVHLVTLSTLVLSQENRVIPGLEASDFRVLDNGRAQKIAVAETAAPVSVALAIQANRDVREYLPFIVKTGSVMEALLTGESGEAAVLEYGSEVAIAKLFESGEMESALRGIRPSGKQARAIDAGLRAISLLASRPAERERVLLFIGQAMDSGSEGTLTELREAAEKENVTVFCLVLPQFGKAFVSDTFSIDGAEKGGFKAGVDLGKLVSALNRSGKAEQATDPFSVLTAATGGTELHFRKQRELEDGLAAIGVQLRSAYVLSYYPDSHEAGYHSVKVAVDVAGAKVYARPGYWMSGE
jgi:VWFA-related protein